jgi:hypothetical protein
MPSARERNALNKVFIPSSARENQYLLAKFKVTDALLERYADLIDHNSAKPYQAFYQKLTDIFFSVNESLKIDSGQFVANDKFARVRFSTEKLTFETEQQIIFLYNPHYHRSENSYFDGAKRVSKITLVFLANGDELRLKSAKFHRKVKQALSQFAEKIGIAMQDIRVCDHQHLTYDLFAKFKGVTGIQAHKLRPIGARYAVDNVELPENRDELTYAVVDIPINRRIKKMIPCDKNTEQGFTPIYNTITEAFIRAAKQHNIQNGAVIANGLVPIVRQSHDDNYIKSTGELLMIGFNPQKNDGGFTTKWAADKLVDTVQLVFLATDSNKTSQGYGRFLNQIEQALYSMTEQLGFIKEKEEILVRFHQHIGYYDSSQ